MKHIFIIFIYFLNFTSLFAQELSKPTNGKADVYIIRDKFNGCLFSFDFFHNDKFIGKLRGLSYIKYECSPGSQLFWGIAGNKDFLELNVESGETYIIKADFRMWLYRGKVKLSLVNKNEAEFDYFKKKLQKKKSVSLSRKEIQKLDLPRESVIFESVKKYHENKQKNESTPIAGRSQDSMRTNDVYKEIKSRYPIILNYNFIDLPFSRKSIELSGIGGIFANPSMSQSLNVSSSFYSFTREGLYRSMMKNNSLKDYYKLIAIMVDVLAYLPVPLTSGWLHEEFHRAVIDKHDGYSFNEMNNFPIFKSVISVNKVKDEDLIKLKKNKPADMVRMSLAGTEGEYLLVNLINKVAFFNNAKSVSFIPFFATVNSSFYVIMCSRKYIDEQNDKMYKATGRNIAKRDLVGFDFLAYTYDLFRPDEPYQNRGIDPSGVGVDRYIKRSQLTHNELSYLKLQGYLQFINFINPLSLLHTSFTIQEKENGDDTRANLYFNHWLSPFGYDISATGLLHYNRHNYAFTLHNYANNYKWFPGIEVETYNYLIGEGKLKHAIPVSARAMLWLQPKNQFFFAKSGSLGGFIETKIYYPASKHFQPYISVSAKTNGWVQGNVYLEKNISAEFGLRAYY